MTFRFLLPSAVLAIFAVSFVSSPGYSQARPSPATQVVSIDFVPLLVNYPIALQYEMKADPTDSWLFRLYFWPSPDPDPNWSAFGVGGAYKIYIADSRALTGLSVAPVFNLFFSHQSGLTGGVGTRSAVSIDIGGDLAYKWIFDQFAVEPIFGLRIGFTPASIAPARATGLEPLIGCSLGYAWQ